MSLGLTLSGCRAGSESVWLLPVTISTLTKRPAPSLDFALSPQRSNWVAPLHETLGPFGVHV